MELNLVCGVAVILYVQYRQGWELDHRFFDRIDRFFVIERSFDILIFRSSIFQSFLSLTNIYESDSITIDLL